MKSNILEFTLIEVDDWGLLDYEAAFARQEQMVADRQQDLIGDTLVLVEHPAVVTLGRRASDADLLQPVANFSSSGVALRNINRGGLATAHEPGQLVVYPILALKRKDLRWYANTFLNVVISVLNDYGLEGKLKPGEPGVWVDGRKICSFGIAIKKWISSHGIALNINNDLQTFNMIIPCGRPQENVTSVARELGSEIDMREIKQNFVQHFIAAFAYQLKP
ncbi:MAG: lipoyl(octanoyl) transferase LipB [Desulfuromusa sp.]|nr:lipoyl(octanoyl) transferase LipB [Desulfuromusa sp.]